MINGRAYTIACDDGEEAHLKDLATHVDVKAREVLGSVGQVGETRMLLMAALLLADEHHDLVAKVAAGGNAALGSSEDTQKLHLKAEQAESQTADMLESAAKKLEDIAARLAHA
jgi:cell division protein ZapA